MISAIKQFFTDRIQGQELEATATQGHTLNLATAALLVEAMRADHNILEQEQQAVQALLQRHLQLHSDDVRALFALAEQEVEDSVSLYQFTSLIDQAMDYEQKVRIIDMLWQVVYADDRLDKYEEALLRKIADLLHVSHRDFIQSKHRFMPE